MLCPKKKATANKNYKHRYGITLQEWEDMFEAQGRKCKCCTSKTPKNKNGWVVDHCHKTKKIRGILCHHCNLALGAVKDDVNTLKLLIKYLQKQGKTPTTSLH